MRYYIPKNIISIAHRGYSAKYKQNSWKALKTVKRKGFNMIAIDIQLCKTGQLIIHKDLYIKDMEISQASLEDIKKKKKDIFTLKEYFNEFPPNRHPVFLMLKSNKKIAQHLFCFLKTFEIKTKNIVCGTFNMNHIDFLKSKMPTLSFALMTKSIINIETLPDITSNMDYLVIHWESLDEKTIEYCHINEIPVITYTLKNDMQFKYIQKYNIDGIISQYRLFPSSGGYEKILF